MDTIRNFFLQGADQPDGLSSSEAGEMEGLLKAHPEMQSSLAQIVNCAARRVSTAESASRAHQVANEQTAQERELFARMRGIARDTAEPTYNYHQFEPQSVAPPVPSSGDKRMLPPAPVSQNANVNHAAAEQAAKRQRTSTEDSFLEEQLKLIAGGMNRNMPSRPRNIGANEDFPVR